MSGHIVQGGNYKNISSTGAVTTKPGVLLGFYVNSTSSGTLVLKDGGSSGTAISGTITPAIGWHTYPAGFGSGGLYATIANTLDVTFIFAPTSGTA